MVNGLDLLVIIVIFIFTFLGYKKGLLLSVFQLFSFIISILIAKWIYPILSRFLLGTWLFDDIKLAIINSLGLNEIVKEQTLKAQTMFIKQLPIPESLTNILLENNNIELYKLLNVSKIEDYIASFLATLCINAISVILVFLIVWLIMRIISKSINVVDKLPVVKKFNKFGGLISGAVQGTLVLWILFTILSIFVIKDSNSIISTMIRSSKIAIIFYERNIFISIISKIAF